MKENLLQMDTNTPVHYNANYSKYNYSNFFNYSGFYYDDRTMKYEALERNINTVSRVIYSLVFLLGVPGNGLVIFITGFRMVKTVNTVWFLSLAVADFTFVIFLPLRIVHLSMVTNASFEKYMCIFNSTTALLSLHASVYHLVVIAADRCVSVWCPVWARNHRTPRRATFVAVGVWILALLLCSPNPYFREASSTKSMRLCFLPFDSNPLIIHHIIAIFQFLFAFVVPFSVITCCYGALLLRLRRSRLSLSSKPFKVITAVIVTFFVLCFPFHVLSFLETKVYMYPDLEWVVRTGVPVSYSLVYFHSCLNPILYFCLGRDPKKCWVLSLLSAFENALVEESNFNATPTENREDLESQNL